MKNNRCHCVLPSPMEQELATIPGSHPGTALRVHADCGQHGYVRLEQLAHDKGLGWYVQKSFTIPADMLTALVAQLRKADCLMPRGRGESGRGESGRDARLFFPVPSLRLSHRREAGRREA